MSDKIRCPECGGEAIRRPAALGGGIFCPDCGVIEERDLVELAHKLLDAQMGMLPGSPRKISKDEIWAEFAKQTIDLA